MKNKFVLLSILLFTTSNFLALGLSKKLKQYAKDCKELHSVAKRFPREIGALTPSSPWLVEEIVSHVPRDEKPLNILEVGAGTGIITRGIIEILKPEDNLVIIEINEELTEYLESTLEINDKNVLVKCSDIVNFGPSKKYDVIVSTIPFTQMPCEVVKNILNKYLSILNDKGILIYIELLGSKKFGQFFIEDKEEKSKYKEKIYFIKNWQKNNFTLRRYFVARNVPPMIVNVLKKK